MQALYGRKLDAGMCPSSVRQTHAVLHRALEQARRWLISENVAAATAPPRPRKKEIEPLDNWQARALLEAARGERFEALFVLALTAGLRIGELLGLKWEDEQGLERGTVRVARTLSAAKSGPRFTPPRSGRSRSIALTEGATIALRSYRRRQTEERLRMGTLWEDQGLVFPSTTGRPLSRDAVYRRSFAPLLKRAGVPRITLHDLRHTCATLLLGQGMNLKYVQELLGHASVAITRDRYSHWVPSMGERAARAMEAALG